METHILSRTDRYKQQLKYLILEALSPKQVWKLRDEYAKGIETIAELSKRSGCPPSLLYAVLTPLYVKTFLKLKAVRIELAIERLLNKGVPFSAVSRKLRMSEKTVREYSIDQYEPAIAILRPWYNERAPKPPDPNDVIIPDELLPPTSRLGWVDGRLTDIPPERKGRCPTCGYIVSIPCLACMVREIVQTKTLPRAEEIEDTDDEIIGNKLLFV